MKSLTVIYLAVLALTLSGATALAAPTVVTLSVGSQAPAPAASGSPAAYSVNVTKSGKKSQTVTLSVSGLPAGVTAFFRQNSLSFPASSRSTAQTLLTLSTSSTVPSGTYSFSVVGTYQHGSKSTVGAGTLVIANNAVVGPPPVVNSLARMPDGSARLTCAGVGNQTFYIQATSDLANPAWTTISTNTTDSVGACIATEIGGGNYTSRFYRTSVVP